MRMTAVQVTMLHRATGAGILDFLLPLLAEVLLHPTQLHSNNPGPLLHVLQMWRQAGQSLSWESLRLPLDLLRQLLEKLCRVPIDLYLL